MTAEPAVNAGASEDIIRRGNTGSNSVDDNGANGDNTSCSCSGCDNPNGRYYDTERYGYAWNHRYAGSCSDSGDVGLSI